MEKKKKLKKLKLNKVEIVNLNDQELAQLQGGSSIQCSARVLSVVAAGYDLGEDYSWWYCEDYTYDGGELTEVVITP